MFAYSTLKWIFSLRKINVLSVLTNVVVAVLRPPFVRLFVRFVSTTTTTDDDGGGGGDAINRSATVTISSSWCLTKVPACQSVGMWCHVVLCCVVSCMSVCRCHGTLWRVVV